MSHWICVLSHIRIQMYIVSCLIDLYTYTRHSYWRYKCILSHVSLNLCMVSCLIEFVSDIRHEVISMYIYRYIYIYKCIYIYLSNDTLNSWVKHVTKWYVIYTYVYVYACIYLHIWTYLYIFVYCLRTHWIREWHTSRSDVWYTRIYIYIYT